MRYWFKDCQNRKGYLISTTGGGFKAIYPWKEWQKEAERLWRRKALKGGRK